MTSQSALANRVAYSGPLTNETVVIDEHGDPSGPVVVFLHSEFGAFARLPLNPELVTTCRVLAVHLPGWGESQGGTLLENLSELATSLWWALDQAAVGSAVIAGIGLGATIAAEMAIQQPGRTVGLCLASPFGLFRTDDTGLDLFGTLPKELMPGLYEDPEGSVALEHFPPPTDAHEKGLVAIRRVVVLGAASRFIFPIPDTGIAKRLYRLGGVKTEIMFGGKDTLLPSVLAEDWQQLIPDATVNVIGGATHMHPYERSEFSDSVASLVSGAGGAD